MKTSTLFLKNILCFVISIMAFSLSAQTIITVDNSPLANATFTTLQEAIDDVATVNGDIIYVEPSNTSYGAATIDKELTIVGRSHNESSNISTMGNARIRASNVTIKGMSVGQVHATSEVSGTLITNIKIYECKIGEIYFGNSYPTTSLDGMEVTGCIIQNGIVHYADASIVMVSNNIMLGNIQTWNPSGITIANNIFRNTSINIYNYGSSTTLLIENNMFIINSNSTISCVFHGNNDVVVSNCLTYNYGDGDYLFTSSGSTTFQVNNTLENTNPLFTNVDTAISGSMAGTGFYNSATRLQDDITLQAGSPALTAGTGGSELGVFADGFNFKNLGTPRGVPVTDILTAGGSVPANGIFNVDISAKAH